MKKLGDLTEKEGKEILELYEKENAINNLLKILDSEKENELYMQAIQEQKEIKERHSLWWLNIYKKYQWSEMRMDIPQDYYVDFRENIVYLQ